MIVNGCGGKQAQSTILLSKFLLAMFESSLSRRGTLHQFASLEEMKKSLIGCERCSRLVQFREKVMPRKRALAGEKYWRRPVPGFGDKKAWLLILGLAPSVEGGNRTGRIFTGDASARFLFRMLHAEGFASQGESLRAGDGMVLKGCYLTAAVKCVPPENRPTEKECDNCSQYLWNEMHLLKELQCVLVLGRVAYDRYRHYVKMQGGVASKMVFAHGKKCFMEGFPMVYMSYHPSPQNTNTGKLTENMFRRVLKQIRSEEER
jgi:uracil-DNA glycosylase